MNRPRSVCVCVCGWVCLPSGCSRLQAVFNDSSLVSLHHIRDDAVRYTHTHTHTHSLDGSHTALFARDTHLHKQTHTHVHLIWGLHVFVADTLTSLLFECVCVCVCVCSFSRNQQPDRATIWFSVAQPHVWFQSERRVCVCEWMYWIVTTTCRLCKLQN